MNYKFKKSQILILSAVAALLLIAPLLSSTLRPTCLYFVLNLLIIALGAEAGVLSVISRAPVYVAAKPVVKTTTTTTTAESKGTSVDQSIIKDVPKHVQTKIKAKVVEKSASEKIGVVLMNGKVDHKVKKCPSTPSLFFIGSAEEAVAYDEEVEEEEEEEEEEEVVGGLSGPELFTKAETFIGNFYKQLKMQQREESWKRIHGFYQKAF